MLRYLLGCLLTATAVQAQTSWILGRTNVPTVSSAFGIAFGNGRFVATTDGTNIGAVWSTDGVDWQASADAVPSQGSIVFARGAFYLAGSNRVLRSTDGSFWQTVYSDPNGTVSLRGLASDGTSLLVGTTSNAGQRLYFSIDGAAWGQTEPVPFSGDAGTSTSVQDIASWAGRYFVSYVVQSATGVLSQYVASTTDGTSWTPISALARSHYLAAGNGRIVTVYGTNTFVSTDGQNSRTNPVAGIVFNGGKLAFTGGRFFALNTLTSSLDGATWSGLASANLPPNPQMTGIAYGNGRYVAVGWQSIAGTPTTYQDIVASVALAAPPQLSLQPLSQTRPEHAPTTLTVTVANSDASTTYQWLFNGGAITGATAASYTLSSPTLANSGHYTATVRNTAGTVSSDTATVTFVPADAASRIINFSALTSTDAAEENFILGFVLSNGDGQTPKPVLVRAAGPSLAYFSVPGVNPNPRLELYADRALVGSNDDWGGGKDLTDLGLSVGAFGFLAADSKDAALYYPTALPGPNSINATGTAGATGAILAEVYEVASSMTAATPHLKNVSVRKRLAADGSVTLGFVISGSTDVNVLVRAIGPSLAPWLPNPLPNPKLSLYRQGATNPIATNDDWSGTDALKSAASSVAAFPLDPASIDSALVATVSAGGYTAQVSPVAGTGPGVVLVEVYEMP